MFKILNGYENIDTNKKDSRTRGHKVTLVKDPCRLDIRNGFMCHVMGAQTSLCGMMAQEICTYAFIRISL